MSFIIIECSINMIKSEHLISVRSRYTFHANGICVSKNITVWIHKELL